jgi:hypothetical protein
MADPSNHLPPLSPQPPETQQQQPRPPQPPQRQYHVKLRNPGMAARVFHDGARPVRIGPGETLEDETLGEDTIARLKAEKHSNPEEPPPLEVTQLGEAGGHEGGEPAGHKRRPAPTG